MGNLLKIIWKCKNEENVKIEKNIFTAVFVKGWNKSLKLTDTRTIVGSLRKFFASNCCEQRETFILSIEGHSCLGIRLKVSSKVSADNASFMCPRTVSQD